MNVIKYKNLKPKLLLENFFNGDIEAWGLFEDRFGIIRKRFTCKIQAKFNKSKNTIEVNENFTYDDKSKEQRTWVLTKINQNEYEAYTESVIGKGTGKVSGNAFHWRYIIELPLYGRKTRVKFDDRMYLISKDVIINKAVMTKFGLKLGTCHLYFKKIN